MRGKDDFPQLDHDGPELVYQQIANHIAGQIERGELKPGQRLTAERELAEGYGVAYMTVRRAIREIVALSPRCSAKGTTSPDLVPEALLYAVSS